MTQIKKILDKQGDEVFIRTSTRAVVDENGYTAESRLQAMQDEINAAQLEVGAVPSDLTPTKNSTNWVTSGGLYNLLYTEVYNDIVLSQFETVKAFISNTNTWTVNYGSYSGKFIPVESGDELVIKGHASHSSRYAFLTTNTYTANAAPSYANNTSYVTMDLGEVDNITVPSEATYLWIATYSTADITPEYIKVKTLESSIPQMDDIPTKDSSNYVSSNGIYNEFEKYRPLQKTLSMSELTGDWIKNGQGQYLYTRYRAALKAPMIPINVSINNVPNGLFCCIMGFASITDVFNSSVVEIEGTAWGGTQYTFEDENTTFICVGFKKGAAGTSEITAEDIQAINSSVTVIISPWTNNITDEFDIINANDENRTLRYLRSLKRPNYSLDGNYTAGITPFTLLHFSDLHSDAVNLNRIVQYKTHYSAYIDDAICTGDLIRNTFGESYDFWSASGAESILVSTGNHEYYNGESSSYYQSITPKQVYDKFFSPYISSWGSVVFPEDASTNGYNYYYKDYTSQKIRLIVLDSMANMKGERNGVQAAWLATVLENARTSNLHVLCAIHIGSTIETPFYNSFTSYHIRFNSDTGANAGTFSEFYTLRDAVETFINNGGNFICWIGGHRHPDSIGILTGYNQGSIHVATASSGHAWNIIPLGDDCDRTDGTKQQDSFNIYSIDTEKKLLRIFKVGSDIDRNGRHKGSLVYDYDNLSVLYVD